MAQAQAIARKPVEPKAVVDWPATKVEMRPIESLIPYARNPNMHSPAQVEQIVASIKEFGWTIAVLVDEEGVILAGHGRVMAAHKLGIKQVPVTVAAGWSEAQKKAYVIADNQLPRNSEFDLPMLRAEIADLKSMDFHLPLLGFDDLQLVDFVGGLGGAGGQGAGAGAGGDEDDEQPPTGLGRELTEDESKVMLKAWKSLAAEWADIIAKESERGFFSTTYTKRALAVRFVHARLFGEPIQSASTLAYTPHRMTTVGYGDNVALPDHVLEASKDDAVCKSLQFILGGRPRLDTLLGSTLALHGARLPGEFPIFLARDLIDEFVTKPGGVVLDPCHGWGGRLLGFLLSRNAARYVGFDVDPRTHKGVREMFDDLHGLADGHKSIATTCCPFEDAKLSAAAFDFALTSPPYFDVEKYGGELSSWRRYPDFDKWVAGFYRPMIEKAARALKTGAVFALQVGNQSHPLESAAKPIAADAGLEYVETRGTSMRNNQTKTDAERGEIIMIFRKLDGAAPRPKIVPAAPAPAPAAASTDASSDPASKYGKIMP